MSATYKLKCLVFLAVYLTFGALLAHSVAAEEKKCEMKFNDGIVITDAQIDNIKNIAKKDYNGVMEKISFGRIGVHGGLLGAQIHFENEIIDSYAIEREVIVIFVCETTNTQSGVMKVVTDKKFKSWGLLTTVKCIFKLSKGTFHFILPPELSYEEVDRLLKAIDTRTYEINEPEKGNTQIKHLFMGKNDIIDVTKIISIKYDRENDLIVVRTAEWLGAGRIYQFRINNDTIIFVSAGYWCA